MNARRVLYAIYNTSRPSGRQGLTEGPPKRPPRDPKDHQRRPPGAPERHPRTPQGPPKGPKGPQGAPLDPHGGPTRSQGHPRDPQGSQKNPKGPPTDPQGTPTAPPRSPRLVSIGLQGRRVPRRVSNSASATIAALIGHGSGVRLAVSCETAIGSNVDPLHCRKLGWSEIGASLGAAFSGTASDKHIVVSEVIGGRVVTPKRNSGGAFFGGAGFDSTSAGASSPATVGSDPGNNPTRGSGSKFNGAASGTRSMD